MSPVAKSFIFIGTSRRDAKLLSRFWRSAMLAILPDLLYDWVGEFLEGWTLWQVEVFLDSLVTLCWVGSFPVDSVYYLTSVRTVWWVGSVYKSVDKKFPPTI